ncbi:hypothetical protein ACQP1K_10830 [Sphaerimonospora sp. CA-214678]|uniref:hypothetical protein n=1 Tax=Sphaerimonospora sp. CA-214678 TaxID=3240029 RepID=UPI003D93ACC8
MNVRPRGSERSSRPVHGKKHRRIARLRPEIIAAVKTAVDAAATPITEEGLSLENELLTGLFTPEAAVLARKQLAAGAQTREGERRLEEILNAVY